MINERLSIIKELLIDNIESNLYFRYNSNKDEIIIRCPYCGDSIKNESHVHLFIGINEENNFPYYCQKCNSKGIIDEEFLRDINIFDFQLLSSIRKYSKIQNSKNCFNKKFKNDTLEFFYNRNYLKLPNYQNNEFHLKKLNYLNNRYSFKLDPEIWINEYKVIFSFKRFLKENNIKNINLYSVEFFENLKNNYIGFLSFDENFIIFRNINKDVDKKRRYYIYNIFGREDAKRFYIPKSNEIDIFSEKLTVVLAEGPFDIIGVKEYFYKDYNKKNIIFTSISGKGYNLFINYLARLGFLNLEVHIYSDSDVELNKFKYMKKINPIMKLNNVKVFYNSKCKDFGIKLEDICLKSNFI